MAFAFLSPHEEMRYVLERKDFIMKTNQIMIRQMGEFTVSQRTIDGKFDCTSLLNQWNNSNKNNTKKIGDYLRLKETREFVKALMEEPEFKDGNSRILKDVDYKYFPKSIVIVTRGKYGGTYMTPLMFLDFAMWLNPAFKVKVLKFVQDEMIKFRNLAGDAYPAMCRSVCTILPGDIFQRKIKDLAKSLNIIVYGKHESEMRNKIGDEAKIRELYELELQIAQWIDLGFIKDYNSLKSTLTKLYYRKYPNVLPI